MPSINRPFRYIDSGFPALKNYLALFLDNLCPYVFLVFEFYHSNIKLSGLFLLVSSFFPLIFFLSFSAFVLLSENFPQLYLPILIFNFISTIFFISKYFILFSHCSCPTALPSQLLRGSCPFAWTTVTTHRALCTDMES